MRLAPAQGGNALTQGIILSLRDVCKNFGALKVSDEVNFDLGQGEALGIIGPNGAGKSTLFNLIGGTLSVSSGTINFEGEDITSLPASARCHRGIARSFQTPHPFSGISVYENLLAASHFGNSNHADPESECRDILDLTGLLQKANRPANSLSLLERKRLEMARAVATGPKLLLLDEIAGGLTEAECRELVETIKVIRDRGVSIIWIEHIVHALVSVVERLLVIDFGKVVTEGPPNRVMSDPMVQEIYMGIEVENDVA